MLPCLKVTALVVSLLVMGCSTGQALTPVVGWESRATRPQEIRLLFRVVKLPRTDVVDLTKPLPPVPHAEIAVKELGQKWETDKNGEVAISVPLGLNGRDEAICTFVATSNDRSSALRQRLYPQSDMTKFVLFLHPDRDLFEDHS